MTIQIAATRQAPTLGESWDYCRRVTRREASNFYYGLALLPRAKRAAMFSLYAWMRHVDDIADEEDGRTAEERIVSLENWRQATAQVIDGHPGEAPAPNLWPAFVHAMSTYRVPAEVFEDSVAGHKQDVLGEEFGTFEQLREYCYRVAGTVGIASIHIWGFEGGRETEVLAVHRGVALQLTNILRDLREDAGRGRVYLPAEDLVRFGLAREDLLQGRGGGAFEELMRFEIARAQEHYDLSRPLEERISPECRPTLATMTRIYHGLLEKMALDPTCVMSQRVSLSLLAKLALAVEATWLS